MSLLSWLHRQPTVDDLKEACRRAHPQQFSDDFFASRHHHRSKRILVCNVCGRELILQWKDHHLVKVIRQCPYRTPGNPLYVPMDKRQPDTLSPVSP